MSESITSVEDAVAALGALPVPGGARPQPLSNEQRTMMAGLLAGAKPATAELVAGLAKTVRDVREHEHPTWEDLYCLNLLSYMGERMGPVLRRLIHAEARIAELEAERHSTNESLSTAAEALRVQRDRLAELEEQAADTERRTRQQVADDFQTYGKEHERFSWGQAYYVARDGLTGRASADRSADKLTQLLAPTQALREPEVSVVDQADGGARIDITSTEPGGVR